jgi:hypothetical protein
LSIFEALNVDARKEILMLTALGVAAVGSAIVFGFGVINLIRVYAA